MSNPNPDHSVAELVELLESVASSLSSVAHLDEASSTRVGASPPGPLSGDLSATPSGSLITAAEADDRDHPVRSPDTSDEQREAAAQELRRTLDERVRVLTESSRPSPFVTHVGVSNAPHDCMNYVADYREQLPEDHNLRVSGPPLQRQGTVEAAQSMSTVNRLSKLVFDRQHP